MNHGDYYRGRDARPFEVSLVDISTARGRNNIYLPGRWKAAGLSNPLHFLFRTALHSARTSRSCVALRTSIFTYLQRTIRLAVQRGAALAHYFFPVTLKRAFVIHLRVRVGCTCVHAYACCYLQGTLGESTPSIRGKGKRVATTPRQHLNSR